MVTIENFPDHARQLPIEQVLADREFARQADRLNSDCVALPQLFHDEGVVLNHEIEATLTGESSRTTGRTNGFAWASIMVGEVVNKVRSTKSLFNTDELPKVEQVEEDGYTDLVPRLPSREQLQRVVESRAAGEMSSLLSRVIADTVHPYEKQTDDPYVELQPRPSSEAYETGRYQISSGATANLCSNTEEHFVYYGFGESHKLNPIRANGEVVALQKKEGDHTAILVKPAILNGVRLPEGSIMIVDDRRGEPRFSFGRLSLFNLPTAEEAARQMPEIVWKEFSEKFWRLSMTMREFNELVGREVDYPSQYANDLLDEFGWFRAQSWDGSVEKIAESARRAADYNRELIISDPQYRTVANMLSMQRDKSYQAAEAKVHDKEAYRTSEFQEDPHTRDKHVKTLGRMKRKMYRIFGPEAVKKTQLLLDAQVILERTAERVYA